jgi:trimeric autotransporter adhesin
MTDVKLALRGLRGEGFADLSRRIGTLGIADDATDAEVLDAFTSAAAGHAEAAAEALDAAQVALAGLGIDQFFDTKSAANAGTIANGELILVWADESQGGSRTYYVKESGALVFKAQVGAPSRFVSAAGNVFYGSLAANLNDTAAGTKDGDINTGFGLNVMPNATSAYACAAFGYGAGAAITTGHSNTLIGYQAGHAITTGIMNTLIGLDAAYQSTALNYCVVVGHHCLNSGNFSGSGAVIIGQQTARSLTEGEYLIAIGRNVMANSPATGSTLSEVIGGASAISSTVVRSTIVGADIVTNSGASVTDSVLMGYRNHYAATSVGTTLSFGTYGFFRASATGVTSDGNTGVGCEHGFQVSGDNNVFIGYRAAYQSSNASVTGSVCIGPFAGFNDLASNELVIANTDGSANVLIRGNFTTGDVTIRNDLNVGGDIIKIATAKTPASAGATGVTGQICWDASYIYVCTATDTWKRVAIATW